MLIAERLEQFVEVPVFRSVLPNGLTVVTANTGSAFVRANLAFRVGAVEDGKHLGLAHMLEHLVCHGEATDGVNPLFLPFELGGGSLNATTSYLATEYYIDTIREERLRAIDALLCATFNAHIWEGMVANEVGPIKAEIAMRENDFRFRTWLNRVLLPNTPALHTVVPGTPESVASMTAGEIEEHYYRYYVAENAVLVVTGGIDHKEITNFATSWDLPSGKANAVRTFEPTTLGRFTYQHNDKPPAVCIYYAPPHDSRDQLLVELGCRVMTGMRFSPTMQRLRYKERIAYFTGGNTVEGYGARAFIEVAAKPHDFAYVEAAVLEMIDEAASGKLTNDAWNSRLAFERRRVTERMETYASAPSYNDWADMLADKWIEDSWEVVDRLAFLRAVTREEVADALHRLLPRNAYGVLTVDPH